MTNGTLLDESTVEELRSAGILFGVSIDGDKKSNDYYRKDKNGNGVHKQVTRNIKKIKEKSLMGAAVTLTDKNTDLIKTLKHLINLFPTISIKPVRSIDGSTGINDNNICDIKHEYTKLHNFLLKEIREGRLWYIASLLNGDDYFGKFLLRTITGSKVLTRCDAGIGRFSLSSNGKIYACPAAVDIEELAIGDIENGLDMNIRDKLWNNLLNKDKCGNCYAKFVCGGACLVNSYYTNGTINGVDNVICELNRHLYKLALHLNYMISKTIYYDVIYKGCIEKTERFDEDIELKDKLEKLGSYSFTELKYIKDNKYEDFKKL